MVLTPGNRSRDVFEPRRCREGDSNIRQSAFGLQWNLDDNACTYDWNRREREQQQQQQQLDDNACTYDWNRREREQQQQQQQQRAVC